MLDRSAIRPNRHYWIKRRESTDIPTIAFIDGELPSLNIKPLDNRKYPSCSDYDFLAEANLDELFNATFHGLSLGDLLTPLPTETSKVRIAD